MEDSPQPSPAAVPTGKIFTCHYCEPPHVFSKEGERKVHHRITHQASSMINHPVTGESYECFRDPTSGTFSCPRCISHADRDPVRLKRHVLSCLSKWPEKSYTCEDCDDSIEYPTIIHLKDHHRVVHQETTPINHPSGQVLDVPRSPGSHTFTCPRCVGFSHKDPDRLTWHCTTSCTSVFPPLSAYPPTFFKGYASHAPTSPGAQSDPEPTFVAATLPVSASPLPRIGSFSADGSPVASANGGSVLIKYRQKRFYCRLCTPQVSFDNADTKEAHVQALHPDVKKKKRRPTETWSVAGGGSGLRNEIGEDEPEGEPDGQEEETQEPAVKRRIKPRKSRAKPKNLDLEGAHPTGLSFDSPGGPDQGLLSPGGIMFHQSPAPGSNQANQFYPHAGWPSAYLPPPPRPGAGPHSTSTSPSLSATSTSYPGQSIIQSQPNRLFGQIPSFDAFRAQYPAQQQQQYYQQHQEQQLYQQMLQQQQHQQQQQQQPPSRSTSTPGPTSQPKIPPRQPSPKLPTPPPDDRPSCPFCIVYPSVRFDSPDEQAEHEKRLHRWPLKRKRAILDLVHVRITRPWAASQLEKNHQESNEATGEDKTKTDGKNDERDEKEREQEQLHKDKQTDQDEDGEKEEKGRWECTECIPHINFQTESTKEFHRRVSHLTTVDVILPTGESVQVVRSAVRGGFPCPVCNPEEEPTEEPSIEEIQHTPETDGNVDKDVSDDVGKDTNEDKMDVEVDTVTTEKEEKDEKDENDEKDKEGKEDKESKEDEESKEDREDKEDKEDKKEKEEGKEEEGEEKKKTGYVSWDPERLKAHLKECTLVREPSPAGSPLPNQSILTSLPSPKNNDDAAAAAPVVENSITKPPSDPKEPAEHIPVPTSLETTAETGFVRSVTQDLPSHSSPLKLIEKNLMSTESRLSMSPPLTSAVPASASTSVSTEHQPVQANGQLESSPDGQKAIGGTEPSRRPLSTSTSKYSLSSLLNN